MLNAYRKWINGNIHTVNSRQVCYIITLLRNAVHARSVLENESQVNSLTYGISDLCDSLESVGCNPLDYLDFFLAEVEK